MLALGGAGLALGLKPSAATDTFVSASSPAYRATAVEQRHFGSDAVVVLVRAPLTTLLAPAHLATLTALEACLAGQYVTRSATLRADLPVPAGSHAAYGGAGSPCGALMRMRPAQVVYGPGTFLNRAVAAVNSGIAGSLSAAKQAGERAAAAALKLARARGLSRTQALADATTARQTEDLRALARLEKAAEGAGLTGVPSIADEAFVRQIVFGAARGSSTPRPPLRLPLPQRRRGAHPGAAARLALERPAGPGDRAHPRRRAHAPIRRPRRRVDHRHRGAGRAARPHRPDHRRDRRAARGRSAGDGRRAARRVPPTAAAAAARGRTRRHRDHVRAAVADRRDADAPPRSRCCRS